MSCDDFCHPQGDNCEELKTKLKKTLKDGRPSVWGRAIEKAKNWSGSERDRVTEALLKLPSRLLKFENMAIYRMAKSADKGNPASNLDLSIALYDESFNGNPPLDRVLAHELAHLYYRAMSGDDKEAYRVAAN
jgi:hypothetical protein